MAVPSYDITGGLQSMSGPGPINPGVSVANIVGDWTLVVLVVSLSAGATARIQFEQSTNGFTNSMPIVVQEIGGLTVPVADMKTSFRRYDLPSSAENDLGILNGVVRANITQLNGSLSLRAWIET